MEPGTGCCSRMETARMLCGRERELEGCATLQREVEDFPRQERTPEWGCATLQREVEDFPR
jgi:hypothetical protein